MAPEKRSASEQQEEETLAPGQQDKLNSLDRLEENEENEEGYPQSKKRARVEEKVSGGPDTDATHVSFLGEMLIVGYQSYHHCLL